MELNELAIYPLIDTENIQRFCDKCEKQGIDYTALLPHLSPGFFRKWMQKRKCLKFESNLIVFAEIKNGKVYCTTNYREAVAGLC